MPNLQAYVAGYVAQLAGPDGEDAWHSLVEAGPAALPHLAEALDAAAAPHIRASLVRVAAEFRSSEAVPLLKRVLEDRDAEVWKCALDGLVMLGGQVAVDALVSAKAIATPERREWIDEALRQVIGARGGGNGTGCRLGPDRVRDVANPSRGLPRDHPDRR